MGLPDDRDMTFAKDLSAGMTEAAEQFACPIVGGDITSWDQPRLTVGTALVARPAGVRPIRRNGAKPGDLLFVTGDLGGSVLGRHLEFAAADQRGPATGRPRHDPRHDRPVGRPLDRPGAHRPRERRGGRDHGRGHPDLRGRREAGRPPTSSRPSSTPCNDGEDFELLLAVEPVDAQDLLKQNPLAGVRLTHIGQIVEGSRRHAGGRRRLAARPEAGGYEHFR